MSDTAWPCRCDECASPTDSCEVCKVLPGEVCERWCPEHPTNKVTCATMAQIATEVPQIEEHW
jgi:hypothetical protein